jgi:hypothetical protein
MTVAGQGLSEIGKPEIAERRANGGTPEFHQGHAYYGENHHTDDTPDNYTRIEEKFSHI